MNYKDRERQRLANIHSRREGQRVGLLIMADHAMREFEEAFQIVHGRCKTLTYFHGRVRGARSCSVTLRELEQMTTDLRAQAHEKELDMGPEAD